MDAKKLLESNIIDLLGIKNIPEDRQKKLLDRMSEVVQHRISDRVLEKLSETDKKAFDELLATDPKEEAVNTWLQNKVPEFQTIAAEEVLRFKKQMVEDANTVRNIVEGK
ncbi:hypothetical protein KKG41_06230 [Patescibacteria group bacterium]|nr:hypothetical protein [Patescibacteria group bacterium]MBU1891079.1 hypothetical protein [Patescibacteria group bacterium]